MSNEKNINQVTAKPINPVLVTKEDIERVKRLEETTLLQHVPLSDIYDMENTGKGESTKIRKYRMIIADLEIKNMNLRGKELRDWELITLLYSKLADLQHPFSRRWSKISAYIRLRVRKLRALFRANTKDVGEAEEEV